MGGPNLLTPPLVGLSGSLLPCVHRSLEASLSPAYMGPLALAAATPLATRALRLVRILQRDLRKEARAHVLGMLRGKHVDVVALERSALTSRPLPSALQGTGPLWPQQNLFCRSAEGRLRRSPNLVRLQHLRPDLHQGLYLVGPRRAL
jgi:hypothetical protein